MKTLFALLRSRFLLFVNSALLLAFCSRAHALNPLLDISQYARTSWKNREGFIHGVIGSIVQGVDGYLWLGIDSGLYRFDGVRAVAWRPPWNQRLPPNAIRKLLVTRDGTLWIGTFKGLVSWKDAKLARYPKLDGLEITGLVQDRAGVVWAAGGTEGAGTEGAIPSALGKLCSIQDDTMQCSGSDGSLGEGPVSLLEDSKGNLWVGMENGLWRWKPDPPNFYPVPRETLGIQALAECDNGGLVIAALSGAIAYGTSESRHRL